MKKLILVIFAAVCLIAGKAKGQDNVPTEVFSHTAGTNLQDDFSYWVTSDGYLHYSLIDLGAGGENYESYVLLSPDSQPFTFSYQFFYNEGGGNISGSIYIGTSNQDIWISHGAGYISGEDAYDGETWEIHVYFDEL